MFGKLFGSYLLNNHTGEIHKRNAKQCQYKIGLMTNKQRITKRKMLRLLKKEKYDGCIHCLPEYNTK